MKILIAYDGSVFGGRALDYVLEHPEMFGKAELALIHVVLPLPPRAAMAAGAEIVATYLTQEHDLALESARTRLARAGRSARELCVTGQPGVAVAEEAERGGHDLVVMGSHGHGVMVGLLLGSTVNKVLASCSRPVLVVR